MATSDRPLSPHLQVYKPQLTSVLSITHRFTGMFLVLGAIGWLLWLLAIAGGPETYQSFVAYFAHPVTKVFVGLWVLALNYHLLNGIRHLFWDAGKGFELKTAYASGYAVLVGVIVLTAVVLWAAWGGAA